MSSFDQMTAATPRVRRLDFVRRPIASRSRAALTIAILALSTASVCLLPLGVRPADADSLRDEQGFNCLVYRPLSTCIVPFDFDSARITPKGRAVIDLVLTFGAKYGFSCSPVLSVSGHADRAGSEEYNMALSLRRAEAVRDALAAGGYVKDELIVGKRGETESLVETPDGVPNAENRYVVIVVGYGGCGPVPKDTP